MKKIITHSITLVLAILSIGNAFASNTEADTVLATKLIQTPSLKTDHLETSSLNVEDIDANGIVTANTLRAYQKISICGPLGNHTERICNPSFRMQLCNTNGSPQFSINMKDDSTTLISTDTGYGNYYPIHYEASEFNFTFGTEYQSTKKKSGTLNVDGRIVCKEEIRVAEVNTDKVNAKDINVELGNAADYVFEEGYDLKSLGEVEEYVKSNKHLPGVPSASEFQDKGMNVSEMSNLLLEKVEELTLHLIRMQKEIDQLREENNALKNKE
ncbi:MAG: hypothetical protein IK131_00780 [Paludibacteraceae bacterium]|nr:hypothetical protein [Paludibacteraceae bacterium]